MDFGVDVGAILDAFWDQKSMQFFDRFLDVLFLRFRSATCSQRDFGLTSTVALTAQMSLRRHL